MGFLSRRFFCLWRTFVKNGMMSATKEISENVVWRKRIMNTSVENLTHKMQRAAVGKMVDVVLSHADKDRQKTVGQLVDVAKQFYGSSFSDEA